MASIESLNLGLAWVYIALASLCAVAITVRASAACRGWLPFAATHVVFLVSLLLFCLVRALSGFCFSTNDTLSFKNGAGIYNLVNTGPLIVFLSIFLLLIYHVAKTLQTINTAFDAVMQSIPEQPLIPDSTPSGCCLRVQCRGVRFLAAFKLTLIILNAVMWILASVAYIGNLGGRRQTDGGERLFMYGLEVSFFSMSVVTGLCFLVAGIQLVRKLRHFKKVLHDARARHDPSFNLRAVLAATPPGGSPCDSGFILPDAGAFVLAAPPGGYHHGGSGGGGGGGPGTMMGGGLMLPSAGGASSQASQAFTSVLTEPCPEPLPRGGSPVIRSGPASECSQSCDGAAGTGGVVTATATSPGSEAMRLVLEPGMNAVRTWPSVPSAGWSTHSPPPATYTEPPAPTALAREVEQVVVHVRRILMVVFVCVGAFLFRAGFIFYLFNVQKQFEWPVPFMVPYYALSEIAPIALLLCLYMLPCFEAGCWTCRSRRRSHPASLLDTPAALQRSGLQAALRSNWSWPAAADPAQQILPRGAAVRSAERGF